MKTIGDRQLNPLFLAAGSDRWQGGRPLQGRTPFFDPVGTIENLNNLGLVLRSGLDATFYCFEREQDGEVAYSEEEHLWVGLLNGESRDLNNE